MPERDTPYRPPGVALQGGTMQTPQRAAAGARWRVQASHAEVDEVVVKRGGRALQARPWAHKARPTTHLVNDCIHVVVCNAGTKHSICDG